MYELRFLQSLVFTITVETALLFVLVELFVKDSAPRKNFWNIILTGIVCSGFTLPYIWFILPMFIHGKTVFTLIAESWAVFAETVILMWALRTNVPKAFLVSFTCNIASFLLGKLVLLMGIL
jgi:hypothetical protein